jgi:flagellar basal-body rod modification protein FlgD
MRLALPSQPSEQFGQDQFLTLMLAQLKNQDPLKPLEPGEFLGQLAQFSTVTGIQKMQGSLADLSATMRTSQLLEGTNLVGRDVLAAAGAARLEAAGPILGAVGAPEAASQIEVTVRDAAGALVRRLSVPVQSGLSEFSWDGLDERGVRMPPGEYRLEATARVGTRSESLEMLIQSRVGSVTIDPQGRGILLNTGAGALGMGDVRRVM